MKLNTGENSSRDFSSVSPSAKWLLLLKGRTTIPYARKAAELIMRPEPYVPDHRSADLALWIRTVHFEMRYRGIDLLLRRLEVKNILELSSGYSFRGLDRVKKSSVHYIDTDLPEVIDLKKRMTGEMNGHRRDKGRLELLPLNVLDKKQFEETVGRFEEGEVVIVNEGLLMYLNPGEKEEFAGIVRDILVKRGGYWIVGDIYIRNEMQKAVVDLNPGLKEFYRQHNIEENRFESFEQAEQFFKKMGFVIDSEAKLKPWQTSSFRYLLKAMKFKHFLKFLFSDRRKIHATWRLSVARN